MTYDTQKTRLKAVLVSVPLNGTQEAETESSLAELSRLVTTLGFEVIGSLSQKRPSHGSGVVLGDGKLMELAKLTGGTGKVQATNFKKKSKAQEKFEANATASREEVAPPAEVESETVSVDSPPTQLAEVVVFDCDLTPSQLANLQSATGAEVLDRTGVIVEIFSRHARTKEAQLQVEIARLRYLAPRIRATGGTGEDRVGTAGETSLELDKRKVRDRIAELRRDLVLVQREDTDRRLKRSEQHCVALVGYTNAGKSSLMRALTGSEVLVADKLFATLDTTVRSLKPEVKPNILVSDTVGFIKKLPHDLVASFRSTLEEAANASLLLYVVDCSDPTFRSQLEVTHSVLAEIGVKDVPSRMLFNKADKISPEDKEKLLLEFPEAILMSTQNPADVAALRHRIIASFENDMIDEDLFISYTAKGIIGEIRKTMRVLSERYEDSGVILKVRATKPDLEKLKKEFGTLASPSLAELTDP